MRKYIFTPIGAHPFNKFDSKVEKVAIFIRKKTFFPDDLLIRFVKQSFSQMSSILRIYQKFYCVSYGRAKIFKKIFFHFFLKKTRFFKIFFLESNLLKGCAPMGVKYISSTFQPKTSLVLKHFKNIKFHYNTNRSDFNIVCVNPLI